MTPVTLRRALQLESEYDVAPRLNYEGGGNSRLANRVVSRWESSMIHDQVKAEELAESKKQREAAKIATDDGMPVVPEGKARDVEVIQ
jgi:hypothetical protein